MSQLTVFAGGMLLLVGDKSTGNEISFKPDAAIITKYWGRVNEFNYSIDVGKITSCVIIADTANGDKVWVDSKVKVPWKIMTPIQHEASLADWPTVTLPLWTQAPVQAETITRLDQIGQITPHVVFVTDPTKPEEPAVAHYGTLVHTLRNGSFFVKK
jgi:hypothetical protein